MTIWRVYSDGGGARSSILGITIGMLKGRFVGIVAGIAVGIVVGIVAGIDVGIVVGIDAGIVVGMGIFVGIVVGIEGMFGNVGIGKDDIEGIWVVGVVGNVGIPGIAWSRCRAAHVLVDMLKNETSATRRASVKQGFKAAIVSSIEWRYSRKLRSLEMY